MNFLSLLANLRFSCWKEVVNSFVDKEKWIQDKIQEIAIPVALHGSERGGPQGSS